MLTFIRSEDSSDLVFLLVENYTMTTLYGLRIVWEFLAKFISCDWYIFSLSVILHGWLRRRDLSQRSRKSIRSWVRS